MTISKEHIVYIKALHDFGDDGDIGIELLEVIAIYLDEEMGLNIVGDVDGALLHEAHGPVERIALHKLEGRGRNAGQENLIDGAAGFCGLAEGHEQQQVVLDGGNEFEDNLGDDGEGALAAYEELGEVVARGIFEGVGARPDDIAIRQNDFEVEDIIFHHAVLDRARATGIFRDIATNEAGALAGRVGRVHESALTHKVHEFLGDDGRLGGDLEVGLVEVEDFIESPGIEQKTAGNRQAATTQACTSTPRRNRDMVGGAIAHESRNVGGMGRLHDHLGEELKIFGMVGSAAKALLFVDVNEIVAHNGAEEL